jgi:hypothetical protein
MQAKPLFRLSIAAFALAALASTAPVQAQASTHADARAAVLAARAHGELVPAGEAVEPLVNTTWMSERSRADVRNEVLQARAEGELVPAGEATVARTSWVPSTLARAEVKEAVRIARQRGELVPAGESVAPAERNPQAYPARTASYAANHPR